MNPGTVSKILWHFTGGPLWSESLSKQESEPKPMNLSFDVLIKILKSKQLRVSNYSELVRVIVPEMLCWNSEQQKVDKKHNVEKIIKSSPVCCLADIPIQHLNFHSKRYGKFAIGFHRQSAIKHNFNPVLYSLVDSPIVSSIFSGLSTINSSTETFHIKKDINEIDRILGGIQKKIDELDHYSSSIYKEDFDFKLAIEEEIKTLESHIDDAKKSISDFVAFVKTFTEDEFNSIYCEREWRSITPYNFTFEDIAMIVLPKEGGYFENLIDQDILPKYISIIAWEDLMEY